MPKLPIAGMIVLAGFGSVARAADNGTQSAYNYALRCFVADGIATPAPQDDPDGSIAATFRDHARKAFDAVYVMGGKLGYSKATISNDLDHAQAMEARLMMQDPNYLARAKEDCIKLGLM